MVRGDEVALPEQLVKVGRAVVTDGTCHVRHVPVRGSEQFAAPTQSFAVDESSQRATAPPAHVTGRATRLFLGWSVPASTVRWKTCDALVQLVPHRRIRRRSGHQSERNHHQPMDTVRAPHDHAWRTCMLFTDVEGHDRYALHAPNDSGTERPVFLAVREHDGRLAVK